MGNDARYLACMVDDGYDWHEPKFICFGGGEGGWVDIISSAAF